MQRNKDTFGAVLFINGTTATNRDADISLYDYVDVGYGLGLRIMINKVTRANVTIDLLLANMAHKAFILT